MNTKHNHLEQWIIAWIQFVIRHRIKLITAMLALTCYSVFYIQDNLTMSTDTDDMLSADLPWRQLDIQYESVFPQSLDNVLIVIEATTPDQASDAATTLYNALQKAPQKLFDDPYYAPSIPYLQQSAFLFLELDELQDLADRLAAIQPFLGSLLNDQTLRGLFNMLSDAFVARQAGEAVNLKPLLVEINRALADESYAISWQRLMNHTSNNKSIYREFISLKTLAIPDETIAGEQVIKQIKTIIAQTGLTAEPAINIRLSGDVVLAYEELNSVAAINIKAIMISLILVSIILLLGLDSAWLVGASILTLVTGLVATTAFATATVGELNLISVSFAVLYIGLGIDFAIHVSLHYREQLLAGTNNPLPSAISRVSRALMLCALTTVIGFYSFIPTSYQGVAELGWIAGSGILISLLFTLTLLPALLSFSNKTFSQKSIVKKQTIHYLAKLPCHYARPILIGTIIITTIIISQFDKINFDTNTLNLQDPNNESVQTYRDLLNDSDTSPWRAVLLKTTPADVQIAKQKLEQLNLVEQVRWLGDLVPARQAEKLLMIDDLNLLLGDLSINPPLIAIDHDERLKSIQRLQAQLGHDAAPDLAQELDTLKSHLTKLLKHDPNTQKLAALESRMLKNMAGRIETLKTALMAKAVTVAQMPPAMQARWLNHDHYKIEILPKHNLNNHQAMVQFVKQLQSVDQAVTGAPIVSIEAGDAVVTAFQSAFSYTFIAICLLLLFLVQKKLDALIILACVVLGSILTFGFMLLFNIPLNFANIIGFPLLFGVGIDSSIHIVNRVRHQQYCDDNILINSTSRGVLVSTLTTICSIGNLAFSAHLGTASMGLLLSVGLVASLIATMIVLPSFLVWQHSLKRNHNK